MNMEVRCLGLNPLSDPLLDCSMDINSKMPLNTNNHVTVIDLTTLQWA